MRGGGARGSRARASARAVIDSPAMDDSLDRRQHFRAAWPSYGPDWDRAIELGIDVAVLEYNLSLSVEERILQHQRMLELAAALQAGMRASVQAPP